MSHFKNCVNKNGGLKMNRETIRQLQESEDLRARAVAELAINTDKSFKEAEKMLDAMVAEAKKKITLQAEFEAAMDAEFNC